MVHELKTLPEYFKQVVFGLKKFEIRKFDRPYKRNDILLLKEWKDGLYTHREAVCKVTHLLTDIEKYGLKPGFVILSIKLLN